MFVEAYFEEIKRVIDACPLIISKKIELDTRTEFTGIIRGSLVFINNTILHFREVVDVEYKIEKIKYSYQYQEYSTNKCIFRYDNANHHKEIKTFPHHKHIEETVTVTDSKEVLLFNVIEEIEREIIHGFHG